MRQSDELIQAESVIFDAFSKKQGWLTLEYTEETNTLSADFMMAGGSILTLNIIEEGFDTKSHVDISNPDSTGEQHSFDDMRGGLKVVLDEINKLQPLDDVVGTKQLKLSWKAVNKLLKGVSTINTHTLEKKHNSWTTEEFTRLTLNSEIMIESTNGFTFDVYRYVTELGEFKSVTDDLDDKKLIKWVKEHLTKPEQEKKEIKKEDLPKAMFIDEEEDPNADYFGNQRRTVPEMMEIVKRTKSRDELDYREALFGMAMHYDECNKQQSNETEVVSNG